MKDPKGSILAAAPFAPILAEEREPSGPLAVTALESGTEKRRKNTIEETELSLLRASLAGSPLANHEGGKTECEPDPATGSLGPVADDPCFCLQGTPDLCCLW